MGQKKFGYVRVSSKDQNEERQVQNMKNNGIDERDIFVDKQSGNNMKREQYQILKRMVRTGDTIVFDSLTRLGRGMNDVLEEFRYYEKQRINLEFIKEPFINLKYSTEQTDNVIQSAIRQATLTILSAFAEKERLDIKQRQAEGIAIAKSKGKHLGRPKIAIPNEFPEVYNKWKRDQVTARRAWEELDLKRSTFYKLVREYEEIKQNKNLIKK